MQDRRVHDGVNETMYETVCRIIKPSCELHRMLDHYWVSWDSGDSFNVPVAEWAWREAFKMLDRREKDEKESSDGE